MNLPIENMLEHPVLKQILDIIPDGIFVLDINGKVIFWSNSMEKITGLKAISVINKPCRFLEFSTCFGVKGEGNIKKCEVFKGNPSGPVECFARHKSGRDIPVIKNAIPVKDEEGKVIGVIEAITDLTELESAKTEIKEAALRLQERHKLGNIIGKSADMQTVFLAIQAAASSTASVMIQGESGTGKELVAGAIHYQSKASGKPFVTVNCSALSESLLESELFGHIKGSFTGAISDRIGRMEEADGGTLFLDEIGELNPHVQIKLLRVLQEKTIERIGESRKRQLNIRIITATHRDLYSLVRQGKFREDLYYRLKVFPIHIPPLRARKIDIPLLIKSFIDDQNCITGKQIRRLSPGAMQKLMDYDWPGNVRELKNAVEHAFVVCQTETISAGHLPVEIRDNEYRRNLVPTYFNDKITKQSDIFRPTRSMLTKEILLTRLADCHWNKSETARQLGVSRTAVWKRMKQWDIPLQKP